MTTDGACIYEEGKLMDDGSVFAKVYADVDGQRVDATGYFDRLVAERDRLRDENYKLRGKISAIRIRCPNQPTGHPLDSVFTSIIHICRDSAGSEQIDSCEGDA